MKIYINYKLHSFEELYCITKKTCKIKNTEILFVKSCCICS